MPPPRRLGSDFEDRAADYLLSLGWTLLGRRLKMPHGELDLIALDADTLVFVEVKARTKSDPAEFVTHHKMDHLRQAAQEFIRKFELPPDTAVRFDVIVYRDGAQDHLRNAIQTD